MRKTIRYVRVSLMLTVALLAAAVVSTLTIDVGSLLKAPAERYASEYLKRAVTIGSMRLHVFSGHFLMEDFAIGGVNRETIASVLAAGARRVAICTGVIADPDPRGAARRFRDLLG